MAVSAPWRIVVIDSASGARLGREILAPQFLAAHPDATQVMLEAEAARLTRSPVVLAVLSCPRAHPKIPVWEMELSAGAVCQTLLIAAQSLGYAAQWLTEWYAYDDQLLAALVARPNKTGLPVSSILVKNRNSPMSAAARKKRILCAIWQQAGNKSNGGRIMAINLYRNDLPEGLDLGPSVAVDTETTGLSLTRDRLCLVQLSAGDGKAHLVQIDAPWPIAPIWRACWPIRLLKAVPFCAF